MKTYVVFAPDVDTSMTQAMANMPNIPIAFGLNGDLTQSNQPLIVGFHARTGRVNEPHQHFMPGVAEYLPDEPHVVLYMQDNMAHINDVCSGRMTCNHLNYYNNSFWYGYPEELGRDIGSNGQYYCNATDILNDKTQVTNQDYTLQTTLYPIDYVKSLTASDQSRVIDPTKVYAAGHSMAGIGSVMTALWAPELTFAGVFGHAPKLNFALNNNTSLHGEADATDRWNFDGAGRCYGDTVWGSLEAEEPQCKDDITSNDINCKVLGADGKGFYSVTMNAPNIIRHEYPEKNLPPIYLFAGKNDPVTNFSGKPDVVDALNDTGRHVVFFWDDRPHSIRSLLDPERAADTMLAPHATDKAHVAVSNFTFSPALPKDSTNVAWAGDSTWDPGTDSLSGVENTFGNYYGSINGFVQTDEIIESSALVSVPVKLRPIHICTFVEASLSEEGAPRCKCVDPTDGACQIDPPAAHTPTADEVGFNGYWSTPILPEQLARADISPRNLGSFQINEDNGYGWTLRDIRGEKIFSSCAHKKNGSISADNIEITTETRFIEFYVDNDLCN